MDTVVVKTNGYVGPSPFQGDGAYPDSDRRGKLNERIVQAAHAQYQEAASRRKMFHACLQAEATFGTGLTATAVTLTIYNPVGSPVDLVLVHCGVTVRTCGTAGHLVHAANFNPNAAIPATNTEVAVRNGYLGGAGGYGKAYSATTLPAAPVAIRAFAGGITAAGVGVFSDYIDGAIILSPNTAITLQGITIVGTGIISYSWEEVPNQ